MSLVLLLVMAAATPARFTVFTCEGERVEDEALVQALELEVPQVSGRVTRCDEAWRFEAETFDPVVVDLSSTPLHLRARTFALAVQTTLKATAPPPVVKAPGAAPVPAPSSRFKATGSPVQIQIDLGARFFILTPVSAMGFLLARAMTKWRVWGGLELGLTNVVATHSFARSFVALGVVGVRVFELPLGQWSLAGDVAAEVGALATNTNWSMNGIEYEQNNSVAVMFGGWALVGFQRVIVDELALQVAVRAGYDSGVRVELLGIPLLNLNGPFVGLQVGLRL